MRSASACLHAFPTANQRATPLPPLVRWINAMPTPSAMRLRDFSALPKGHNLLKHEPTAKVGIAIKRQKCGWDNDYLLKVVAA